MLPSTRFRRNIIKSLPRSVSGHSGGDCDVSTVVSFQQNDQILALFSFYISKLFKNMLQVGITASSTEQNFTNTAVHSDVNSFTQVVVRVLQRRAIVQTKLMFMVMVSCTRVVHTAAIRHFSDLLKIAAKKPFFSAVSVFYNTAFDASSESTAHVRRKQLRKLRACSQC